MTAVKTTLLFTFLLTLLPLEGRQITAERWDTLELSYRGGRPANPFHDVSLSCTFSHESGRSVTVDGFYDGDRTWRIRFMPPELGRWRYRTESSDPALAGRSGEILCTKPMRPYLHGPLRAQGLHFAHADGTRRFLLCVK